MSVPVSPYLDFLRRQLASVTPDLEGKTKIVAEYSQRVATALWVGETRLPELEAAARREYEALMPRMNDCLVGMDGAPMLAAELALHLTSRPDFEAAQRGIQHVVQLLAASGHPDAQEVLCRIAEIAHAHQASHLHAVKDAYIKESGSASSASSLPQDARSRLQARLRERFPSEEQLVVAETQMVVGGGSKGTYFVDLRNTAELPERVVVRHDHPTGVTATSVADEYALLELVHSAGMPTPAPYAFDADVSVLGAPFVVVGALPGHNIGDWNEVWEPSHEFAVGIAHTLARLHALPTTTGVGARLPGADKTTPEHIGELIESFEASWRSHGRPSIAMEQAFTWLYRHMDFADGRRAIIHGDVGCHNMLGEDGKLTALLDWETASIGHPARELTYTERTVRQMMPWEEYLTEYEQAGGVLPTLEQMDFYRMYRAVFSIHYLFLARSHFYAGLTTLPIHAYATQHMYLEAEADVHENVKTLYERYGL